MGNLQRQVIALPRHLAALQLRQKGLTYDEIKTELGYASKGAAAKAVRSALRKTLAEPAERVRDLEVTRLDRMVSAIWDKVLAGQLTAVDRMIKIMERRARLLGLDQDNDPTKDNAAAALATVLETWRRAQTVNFQEFEEWQKLNMPSARLSTRAVPRLEAGELEAPIEADFAMLEEVEA